LRFLIKVAPSSFDDRFANQTILSRFFQIFHWNSSCEAIRTGRIGGDLFPHDQSFSTGDKSAGCSDLTLSFFKATNTFSDGTAKNLLQLLYP
jgi:hypothetical protein